MSSENYHWEGKTLIIVRAKRTDEYSLYHDGYFMNVKGFGSRAVFKDVRTLIERFMKHHYHFRINEYTAQYTSFPCIYFENILEFSSYDEFIYKTLEYRI